MEWLFGLIPAALSALGGLFGGGQNTSTTTSTPVMDPQVKAATSSLISKAMANFGKPYQQYTGQRVAGPTAARTQLDPLMSSISGNVMGGLNDASGYRGRVRNLLNQGPSRVSVPSMVPGGATVGMTQMPNVPQLPEI